ncbi:pyrroline-5-carboxylate reductase [Pullulanibacillus pueri]|uniref:Pyrroline-5-carboxylate reductase n=1 Tax=Pullulanibacillus pueri TaxID=1437324 RepID=A0A8J2ZYW5_9BACL|nr:pyrroline-5-carboxylate reductase [Pullulanibacillus pueri]MBM7684235.1 pyrroline-5-carboxylate reductase [Pullulanibacillus pueri]GGH87477.1 pyrroline-5-carboxylate reductase [Pullulanibacillus pueri]
MNKIAFIGAGSIAESILSGILSKHMLKPSQIWVTNRKNTQRLSHLKNVYDVKVSNEKSEIMRGADIIILSVKPKDAPGALHSIQPFITSDQLVVSVLAGVSTSYIAHELGLPLPIVRAMPNTSASVGHSATALSAGCYAKEDHIGKVKDLFQTIGSTVVVDEDQLHAITGLSGSGPAYIYYLVEAMQQAATEAQLDPSLSEDLIIQTLVGAAEMLKLKKASPTTLRKQITSPGGTTQAGITTLEEYKFQEAILHAIRRATERSMELGSPFQVITKP